MKYYILLSISSLNPNMVPELPISSADKATLYSESQIAIIDKMVNESHASNDCSSSLGSTDSSSKISAINVKKSSIA
ncbi:MAG: hypothetical protein WBM53_17090 [Maribacter sp.]